MKNFGVYILMLKHLLNKKEPVVELFLKNKKVLDIGCGQGDFLAKDPKNFVGIDINDELMAKAAARGFNVIKAGATKLPFPDRSFEGVYCLNVIEHLFPDDAYKMFLEVDRVLAPGGLFIIGTEWPSRRIWDTFSHTRPYSPKSIEKLISPFHQETFATLGNLKIENVLYKGIYAKNLFLRMFLWGLAVFFPILRRDWLMVIKKPGA